MGAGRILPVGAELQVRHVFKCAEPKPVEVVYAFGLPRDAALRRFRIVGEGFSVSSELKTTAEAAQIYERGIQAGSRSSLEEVPQTMVVPVGMPQDTPFDAYFVGGMLRGRSRMTTSMPTMLFCDSLVEPESQYQRSGLFQRAFSKRKQQTASTEDILVQLAQRIEPDGGLPGKDHDERWVTTAIALFCFLAEGHTATSGAFRAHVRKLIAFLKTAASTPTDARKYRLVELAEEITVPSGAWLGLARVLVEKGQTDQPEFWREAEAALRDDQKQQA